MESEAASAGAGLNSGFSEHGTVHVELEKSLDCLFSGIERSKKERRFIWYSIYLAHVLHAWVGEAHSTIVITMHAYTYMYAKKEGSAH